VSASRDAALRRSSAWRLAGANALQGVSLRDRCPRPSPRSTRAPGTVFRWKAGPGTITSTIQRVERPRSIAWTGRTLGIKAIHFWHFDGRDGGTFVRTEESYEGLVARLLRRSLQKTLDRALDDGLQDLKAEVERR